MRSRLPLYPTNLFLTSRPMFRIDRENHPSMADALEDAADEFVRVKL